MQEQNKAQRASSSPHSHNHALRTRNANTSDNLLRQSSILATLLVSLLAIPTDSIWPVLVDIVTVDPCELIGLQDEKADGTLLTVKRCALFCPITVASFIHYWDLCPHFNFSLCSTSLLSVFPIHLHLVVLSLSESEVFRLTSSLCQTKQTAMASQYADPCALLQRMTWC